jgi:DNA primase
MLELATDVLHTSQEATVPFIDFAELKKSATIERTLEFLHLETKPDGSQLRAACSACARGGDRAIVITPSKQMFYCFAAKIGGDAIALTAHIRGLSVKDAADQLNRAFGTVQNSTGTVSKNRATAPQAQAARKQSAFDPEAYAARLDASHASLASLGISAETLTDWKAGYATSGTNRGRLAIALHDRDGNILGFAGRSLGNEQPALIIPNGINPQEIIFGGDRVEQGTLYLVRDVLDVLRAHESGVTNCVCFLTEISALQVEMLAALMATRHCDTVELF